MVGRRKQSASRAASPRTGTGPPTPSPAWTREPWRATWSTPEAFLKRSTGNR